MAAARPLGEQCIENWAEALRSEAVSCMLPVGPETKMEIPVDSSACSFAGAPTPGGRNSRKSRSVEKQYE